MYILKDIYIGYRIIGWFFFLLSAFKYVIPLLSGLCCFWREVRYAVPTTDFLIPLCSWWGSWIHEYIFPQICWFSGIASSNISLSHSHSSLLWGMQASMLNFLILSYISLKQYSFLCNLYPSSSSDIILSVDLYLNSKTISSVVSVFFDPIQRFFCVWYTFWSRISTYFLQVYALILTTFP